MRNDAALYSGSSSASYASEKRKARIEKKLSQQMELRTVAPVVFEELERAKDELGELLLAIVDGKDSEDEVMVKLSAIRLHRTWINTLEARLKIVLRAKPPKGEESNEQN